MRIWFIREIENSKAKIQKPKAKSQKPKAKQSANRKLHLLFFDFLLLTSIT